MKSNHSTPTLTRVVVFISLVTLQFLPFTKAAIAFIPPIDNPRPPNGSTGSGGSRRFPCTKQSKKTAYSALDSVQALLPDTNIGYTASTHPTFVAYIPPESAKEVILSIKNSDNLKHFRTEIPISGKSGWVTIPMPKNAPALEIGQDYQWFIKMKCDGVRPAERPYVDGWVKRVKVNPTVYSALSQAPSLTKANILGAASLWYDEAATLGHLRKLEPNNQRILASWKELFGWTIFTESEISLLTQLSVPKQHPQ